MNSKDETQALQSNKKQQDNRRLSLVGRHNSAVIQQQETPFQHIQSCKDNIQPSDADHNFTLAFFFWLYNMQHLNAVKVH